MDVDAGRLLVLIAADTINPTDAEAALKEIAEIRILAPVNRKQ
jgi:hypothetical protein